MANVLIRRDETHHRRTTGVNKTIRTGSAARRAASKASRTHGEDLFRVDRREVDGAVAKVDLSFRVADGERSIALHLTTVYSKKILAVSCQFPLRPGLQQCADTTRRKFATHYCAAAPATTPS
jgi:hypothetical protein